MICALVFIVSNVVAGDVTIKGRALILMSYSIGCHWVYAHIFGTTMNLLGGYFVLAGKRPTLRFIMFFVGLALMGYSCLLMIKGYETI